MYANLLTFIVIHIVIIAKRGHCGRAIKTRVAVCDVTGYRVVEEIFSTRMECQVIAVVTRKYRRTGAIG